MKANFGGMPNPPAEMLNQCVLGVTDSSPLTIKFTADPTSVEKGKPGKIVVEATHDKTADGDIAIAPLLVPATAPAVVKPVAKGQTKRRKSR